MKWKIKICIEVAIQLKYSAGFIPQKFTSQFEI